MVDVWISLILFLIVVVIHLLLCRQFKAKGRFEIGLFLVLALTGLVIMWMFLDSFLLISAKYFLKNTAKIIYLLLIPLYLFFYRFVNQVSPPSKILHLLQNQPEVHYDELLRGIQDEKFIEQALEILVRHGYARKKDGRFFLTGKGKLLAFSGRLDQKFFIR